MKGDNFQIILIIVFLLAALIGVLVFSGAIPLGEDNEAGGQGTVTVWGTLRTDIIYPLLEPFNSENPSYVTKYEQKSAETFDQDLLEAIASGEGPDLVFLTDDLAFRYRNKVLVIPYQSYPSASFKQSFAGAGEVFLTNEGIVAFPLTIDPMVMFYNRSMLDSNGIVYPPKDWEEFAAISAALTKKDESNKIIKSGAALGHFSNVSHAKDIISLLFMQAGNPIISRNDAGELVSLLGNYQSKHSLESQLQYYLDFANPLKEVYSWNKSLPDSIEAFSREDLAFYFGYASELMALVNKNPNQNFLAAPVPQIKGEDAKVTMGRVMGIGIMASSKNLNTAFVAAGSLSADPNFGKKLAQKLGVAPARRDFMRDVPNDSFSPVFYNSALYAKTWSDPSDKETDSVFRNMIESVLSGSQTINEAIRDAGARIALLLLK